MKTKTLTKMDRPTMFYLAGDLTPDGVLIRAREIEKALAQGGAEDKRGTWRFYLLKFINWMEDGMGEDTPFSIFGLKGNKKLPFAKFSTLPIVDCPGAGDCKTWCYSLKGMRYPAAMLGMLQNSLLVRYRFDILEAAFLALPKKTHKVRLYVDGDFPSTEILKNWMEVIKLRPSVNVYGYSKSWSEFLSLNAEGYEWPSNYILNLSGGSRFSHQSGIFRAMGALPVTRGEFLAIPVERHHIKSGAYQGKDKEGSREYRRELVEKAKAMGVGKFFPCPGNCGDCMAKDHACGSDSMRGVAIGIGIHG